MMMTPKTRETVGELIYRKRKEKGWTQQELAEQAGISQRTVSGLERGTRKGTRSATLIPMLDALGIPYDEFAITAGWVQTRHAAMQLRRLADELNADERARLEKAHAKLDPYLRYLESDDLATLVRVATSLADRRR